MAIAEVYCKVCHKSHAARVGETPCGPDAWIYEKPVQLDGSGKLVVPRVYATRKFFVKEPDGNTATHELRLPLDLTNEEVDGISAALYGLVPAPEGEDFTEEREKCRRMGVVLPVQPGERLRDGSVYPDNKSQPRLQLDKATSEHKRLGSLLESMAYAPPEARAMFLPRVALVMSELAHALGLQDNRKP